MDLDLLKGRWNNWAWIIVVYLDELYSFMLFDGEDAIDRSVKRAIAAWRCMGFRSAKSE